MDTLVLQNHKNVFDLQSISIACFRMCAFCWLVWNWCLGLGFGLLLLGGLVGLVCDVLFNINPLVCANLFLHRDVNERRNES